MHRKPAEVVSIDSHRDEFENPGPPPQPAQPKRAFFGNQYTEQRFFGMYRIWAEKVSRHYRIPVSRIDEHIVEAIQTRRAA